MADLYILFEHAVGYTLFHTTEFEELSVLLPEVAQTMQNLAKFRSIIQLVAFKPFKSSENALENANYISEGILHPDLQLILETNVPKSKKKKQKVTLGIADSKLGAAIVEALNFNCLHTGIVPEIIRLIKFHFPNLVSGLDNKSVVVAQLGLGHTYSRAKVKFNVNRIDNMVIQSISILDQLDKDINTFSMRIREWYSYHFPELIKIVPDNHLYAQVVAIIKDRSNLPEDIAERLEEVLMDSEKVQNILEVARTSMGMDIAPIDLINIETFCARIVALVKYRKTLQEYLRQKMHGIAPNLSTLIGEVVGARLISHAGSLTNLAKFPASTVQILGAEKALFRALKTRSNTPKYGLIFHSTFIGKAAKQNKGRISRYLANKCSIASRIDCFSDVSADIFGQHLKQQVEDRLKFYDTGAPPAKNIDVMNDAAKAVSDAQEQIRKKRKKDKKLKKQLELSQMISSPEHEETNMVVATTEDAISDEQRKLKKKEKKMLKLLQAQMSLNESADAEMAVAEQAALPKKKKRNKDSFSESFSPTNGIDEEEVDDQVMKKKKDKRKRKSLEMSGYSTEEVGNDESMIATDEMEVGVPLKKKKKKKMQD